MHPKFQLDQLIFSVDQSHGTWEPREFVVSGIKQIRRRLRQKAYSVIYLFDFDIKRCDEEKDIAKRFNLPVSDVYRADFIIFVHEINVHPGYALEFYKSRDSEPHKIHRDVYDKFLFHLIGLNFQTFKYRKNESKRKFEMIFAEI